jgi:dTDP-4-dehydrorhamnose 3,5-epimerase
MKFTPTRIAGVFVVEPEPVVDDRGLFARTFCQREFERHGLASVFVQCSVSFNHKRGTLRGLHYQVPPACDVKLVRCVAGAIYDVVVDLRPDSPTYRQHVGVELRADSRRALYVPEMFAHGFQTLEDGSEVFYQMSRFYAPEKSTGVRFDDPVLGIRWPLPIGVISDRDRNWPLTV